MMKKKYLIYIDILGFKGLAKGISAKTGFEEDVIRQNYLSDPLEKKINEIIRESIEVSKGISEIEGSDNHVLIVDDIQTAFEIVGKVTRIKIPHKDYGFIPLEIGIGTQRIDKSIEVKPINRKEIIEFLKGDIITPYRSYYKNKHQEKTIKETFVLFTPEFFNELEPLDKKYCEKISYDRKSFFVSDLKGIQQRCEIFEFLKKMGFDESKLYDRIDDLYVPPCEYEEIEKALVKDRIVFITGTPESGKTYTAAKLLWEYFSRGYEPKWIRGGEERERIDVRKRLEDIETELKPNHIIYFEDPFGKIKYESRENLEREIGTIIDCVKNAEDVYVIITSREEIFKEFQREHLASVELEKFEKKLNIKKPSYDQEKREDILLKWSKAKDCKWLKHYHPRDVVLEYIRKESNLPTPLSIRDFVISTINITEVDKLIKKIEEKSQETARSFAQEIENMSEDKILFLSFPFIANFSVNFVKVEYEELAKELKIKKPWTFDQILNWFKDDKITLKQRRIIFSHPSYSQSMGYLLIKKGQRTWINREIFCKVFFKLSEKNETAWAVAWAVSDNFDKLPEMMRNELLLKLAEKDKSAGAVARTVAYNFDKLSEKVRNLLFKLSEKGETAEAVARAVADNFDELPEMVRNELLLKLADKEKAVSVVKEIVRDNFRKLTKEVRDLLKRKGVFL
jgi:hypothetical protein